jgi:hypothetical protein
MDEPEQQRGLLLRSLFFYVLPHLTHHKLPPGSSAHSAKSRRVVYRRAVQPQLQSVSSGLPISLYLFGDMPTIALNVR